RRSLSSPLISSPSPPQTPTTPSSPDRPASPNHHSASSAPYSSPRTPAPARRRRRIVPAGDQRCERGGRGDEQRHHVGPADPGQLVADRDRAPARERQQPRDQRGQ